MSLLILAILFPVFGFLLNGYLAFNSTPAKEKITKWLGPLIPTLSFVTLLTHFGKWGLHSYFEWCNFPFLQISFALKFDSLSFFMGLVVSGIGALIHLYSVGYMAHDKGFSRFFSYLNLFIAFMLTLVLADNLWVMFIGWEGVGLASYLLIGFWYEEPLNARAGAKAFVTNRLGDLGFLVGIFLLTLFVPNLRLDLINQTANSIPVFWAQIIALALFIGASGKSAQVPLHIWLADAMAGPTPVSALIHAATMVTAGIFMIARLNGLFVHAPDVLMLIALIGTLTAFLAACLALIQNDIKKILAYSTVSQLGFMAAALGASAFTASLFHLFTHAFFKATLFLAAGALIHSLGGEQDITKMGGQSRRNRWNFCSFLVASLALAGIFPTSGFFSKDEILAQVYHIEVFGPYLFGILLFTTGMTSYYIFRAIIFAFGGEEKKNNHSHHEEHHLGVAFIFPIVFLAIGSLFVGWIHKPFSEFLALPLGNEKEHVAWIPYAASIISLCGIGLSFLIARKNWLPQLVQKILQRRLYFDWFFEVFAMPMVKKMAQIFCLKWGDGRVIDGTVTKGIGFTFESSRLLCALVNGQTQIYLFSMFLGLIVLISWWFYA